MNSRTANSSSVDLTPDVAAVRTAVQSVATFADRRDFDGLVTNYANTVNVDYTSLAGGTPESIPSTTLMDRWASLLPGFDRTHHEVSDIRIEIIGDKAPATANVVADHWLGAEHWQVRGEYQYQFSKINSEWQITSHRFILSTESGSRSVLAEATKRAIANPVSWLKRQQSRKAVMDFLTGLEVKDMTRVNAVWAEDAVQEMPYAPNNFPKRVLGKEALVRQYEAWPQNAASARFTDGIVFHDTTDPETVIVEYHGVVDIKPTSRVYDQIYIGLFKVHDGKIKLFREFFDPTVFSYAFALGEGGSFYHE